MTTTADLPTTLQTFLETSILPAEPLHEAHIAKFTHSDRWTLSAIPPTLHALQGKAQSLHLWNLFLPHPIPETLLHKNSTLSPPIPIQPPQILTNSQYAPLAEIMGRSPLASEICNCSAPDTGNMEVLLKFGTPYQQERYLLPLLRGESRSAFLMTEPDVASSDARNLETTLSPSQNKNGGRYVLNGRKWWSTGVMDPRCKMVLMVARTDPSLLQSPSAKGEAAATTVAASTTTSTRRERVPQTVVILPLPHPGIRLVRPLTVFGYDDAPHGHAEVELINVEVKEEDIILGLGRGFEIAQERLGPGRIHHCMRAIGLGKT
eukprot:CCRYP_015091-RA/>CCRYP_015091-RA protein AED:0.26 eAED:0.26 QI:246/1/1/1/0.66/0.25/4/2592/319